MGIYYILKRHGIFFGILFIYRNLLQRIFNIIIGNQFNLKKIYIHSSAKIVGHKNIVIGQNFYAGRDLWLEAVYSHGELKYNPKILIKNNVAINDSVHIAATNYIEIGNNVLMASKIFISDHIHGDYSGDEQSSPETAPNIRPVNSDKSVIIEDNVWLGEFVSVLPGVIIGKGSIIGCNSVVSKCIPPYSIAVGNPARVVKKYNFTTKIWERYGLFK
ncbi:MAG: acyltransferase [Geobacteraceae bacterium]|nr:acyltransferase [Geobacteraceae bacterium]